jgi:hypothetical protein
MSTELSILSGLGCHCASKSHMRPQKIQQNNSADITCRQSGFGALGTTEPLLRSEQSEKHNGNHDCRGRRRRSGHQAATCRKRSGDTVETMHRPGESDARIKCTVHNDAGPSGSARRKSQLKTGLHGSIQGQTIEHEIKRSGTKAEYTTKSNGRSNGLRDERRMRCGGRCGATVIEQTGVRLSDWSERARSVRRNLNGELTSHGP